MKNKLSFYEKQAVVLWKTSRRFIENKPSFYEKQAVVLWKTSRRFMKNKLSFYEKQVVVLRKSFYDEMHQTGKSVVFALCPMNADKTV